MGVGELVQRLKVLFYSLGMRETPLALWKVGSGSFTDPLPGFTGPESG